MEKRSKKAEIIPEVLGQFLDPAYSYQFMQNPNLVRSKEDALRGGINCVSLAHLAIRELFDYQLPTDLGCAELYLDRLHFKPVESISHSQVGDLAWFGVQKAQKKPEEITLRYNDKGELINWRDFPVKHVAVYTGIKEHGEPLLLHATFMSGGKNVIWPLSEFYKHPRYRKLYAITRLVAAFDS